MISTFKITWRGIEHKVKVEKPKNLEISLHLAKCLFHDFLRGDEQKAFRNEGMAYGWIDTYEKEQLAKIRVISVERPINEVIQNRAYDIVRAKKKKMIDAENQIYRQDSFASAFPYYQKKDRLSEEIAIIEEFLEELFLYKKNNS